MNGYKIINDPVFGFIKVRQGLLLDLVKHPLFQRLARIKQLGLTSMVYPGAQHSRFQHSLGAYHLMGEAILTLSQKGIFIFDSEAEGVEAAILLHDIGHGPFSHVLENTLMKGITHEDVSLRMMEEINAEMNGALTMAIAIFKNTYPKRFLHQLISSQLDMDRLDYLRRDSFFTGVDEGNIGSARIIKMLNVVDDRLVVDAKGIYSIENYLTSRRLMYWQVYLHRTTVACEKILVNLLLRAKRLTQEGKEVFATPPLKYFLEHDVDRQHFESHPEAYECYKMLDDNDIWSSIKIWALHDDTVLSRLAKDLLERRPFQVEISNEPFAPEKIEQLQHELATHFNVPFEDAAYFISANTIEKYMYNPAEEHISILFKDGQVKDISEASELLSGEALTKKNRKYYLCSQRI